MKYYFFIATLFIFSCSGSESVKTYHLTPYDSLENYSLNILNTFLADVTIDPDAMNSVLTDSISIRSFTRKAEGLLYRNHSGDAARAANILEWVLSYQNQDESSEEYGIFKTSPSDQDWHDPNWREFVGCDLINIHAHAQLRNLLPSSLVSKIDSALFMAAQGARQRDVSPYYSNISIMSALLMEYVGVRQHHEELRVAGLKKAKDVYVLYKESGHAFSEFNSPTYYGVNMVALATMRKLGHADTMKQMGAAMEKGLWQTTGDFYHSEMKNMVGPFFRSYGMDMRRYNAIIGLWVGLAFNDPDLAPWPGKSGGKYGEVSNVVPALVLGVQPPQEGLAKFRNTPEARFMEYSIPNHYEGWDVKEVTAMMDKSWMMGGVRGHRRPWTQIFLGTIYWQQPGSQNPGWLLVPGPTSADVVVTEHAMEIHRGGAEDSLTMLIYSHDLRKESFRKNRWELPGINLKVESKLGAPKVTIIGPQSMETYFPNADGVQEAFKISFSLADAQAHVEESQPLVTIIPEKTEDE